MEELLLKLAMLYLLDTGSYSSEEPLKLEMIYLLHRERFFGGAPKARKMDKCCWFKEVLLRWAPRIWAKHISFPWHKMRSWTDPDIKNKNLNISPTLPYPNLTINAYFRMINGNRGCNYNIGIWNCLVHRENQATYKMVEVKQFIEEHNLHFLCLVNTGLYGPESRIRRRKPITTQGILSSLQI